MNFQELLNLISSGNPPNICIDSRIVKDGDIFVAIKGSIYDGHDFIDQAIENGAKYIVCEKSSRITSDEQRATITVDDSTEAAAILAQKAKGNPAKYLTNLAVTGTNGKTTVAFLVRSCIQQAGEKCGLIGTVIYDTCSDKAQEAPLTTPDCLTIAAGQSEMLKNSAKYMVIEASSHALDQNRLANINFKAAAFTNLTGDHLDYHKTREDYLAAKTKLFSNLSPDEVAVLNKESEDTDLIAEKTNADILWYAIEEKADLIAHIESMDVNGAVFTLEYKNLSAVVKTPLLGRYNISNHLAAAGLCLAVGIDLKSIAAGLSALKLIPGRLEKVEEPQATSNESQATILIDYAHTDDALKNVLSTLKPLCKGKLRVVFGCGGDRDRSKRPRMAQVAEELADFVIVTSDNPRTENPDAIINEILTGFKKIEPRAASHESQLLRIIPDRRKAIETAVVTAGKNDIVLIAGKGHENYQIIGKQKFHFSDKEIAQQCLEKLQRYNLAGF